MAVSVVTRPLSAKASTSAGPASPAAIPVRAKIPAPIMPPTPIMVMLNKPSVRLRVIFSLPGVATFCAIELLRSIRISSKHAL
jgi:hypothetical protein